MVEEKKKKKKKSGFGKQFLGGFIIGFLMVGALVYRDYELFDKHVGRDIALSLVGAIICFIITIIIHETGHLFFGLKSGYELVSFRLFSHIWYKEDGKTIHKKNKGIGGILGQCLMKPNDEYDENFKFLAYLRGGYIFNMIQFIILYGIWFIPGLPEILFAPLVVGFFLTGILLVSSFFAIESPIPTDGHNIKMCKKYETSKKALHLQMKVNNKLSEGYTYVDFMDEYDFDFELAKTQPLVYAIIGFKYNALLEQGKIEEAKEMFEQMYEIRDDIPKAFKNGLLIEKFCNLYLYDSKENAIAYFETLPKIFKNISKKPQRQDILAILSLCRSAVLEENYESMRQHSLLIAETIPSKGSKIVFLNWIEMIDNKYNILKNETIEPNFIEN